MPYGLEPSVFVPTPILGFLVIWKDDPELKKLFGIELAKNHKNSFEAACIVFPNEANKALWASTNWVNDPIVIEAKENYTGVTGPSTVLLDKAQLAATLLEFSREKINYNGNLVYAAEAKDRLSALKLYAEVQGFINNKTEINNNIHNNNNRMEIVFVEPEKKEPKKIIEHEETSEETNILDTSPVKLKLVG